MKITYISPTQCTSGTSREFIDMRGHKVNIACRKVSSEFDDGLWLQIHDSTTSNVAVACIPIDVVRDVIVDELNSEYSSVLVTIE